MTDEENFRTKIAALHQRTRRLIALDEKTGCWLWQGARSADGYAAGHRESQHRIMYRRFAGEVLPGLELDHLCRVRHCVNPEHLEAVTPRENFLRGEHRSAIANRTNICVAGLHDLDAFPLRPDGWRGCRQCHDDRRRERRDARLAAASESSGVNGGRGPFRAVSSAAPDDPKAPTLPAPATT